MDRTSLVIMAAGIGSRFGEGIKQLTKIDKDNNLIINYSIADAINAGFNSIVFIIRKDIEKTFKEAIGDKIEKLCDKDKVEIKYAYQEIDDIPSDINYGRTKPWGTGQAILSIANIIDNPFAVINADDYYGKESYQLMYHWLTTKCKPNNACMIGFVLKNTLSETGSVTRGICNVNSNNQLVDIAETYGIEPKDGIIISKLGNVINPDCTVSMNMWGFDKSILDELKIRFIDFFKNVVPLNPLKCEYLLPTIVGELVKSGKLNVDVLNSPSKWFGITYKEDTETVIKEFDNMISSGIYTLPLKY